jgi:NAD+ diphosphatase
VNPEERRLVFANHEHDRAVDHRRDARWLAVRWADASSRVLVVTGSEIEVDPGTGQPLWLTPHSAPDGEHYLLGVAADGAAVFACHLAEPRASMAHGGLRELGVSAAGEDVHWLCHAVALAQWHATHTHCPRCGTPTEVDAAGAERRCPADGSAHFPRVDPAVIMLITDAEDRALLGRHVAWPLGRYSTLAGFVEPGESAEQAVRREVAEEAGVAVVDVQLLATQPWPFPSSLMIGAVGRVAGTPVPHPDGEEMAEVRWFNRDELRAQVSAGTVMVPGPISISRWLIERWFGDELPDQQAGWR